MHGIREGIDHILTDEELESGARESDLCQHACSMFERNDFGRLPQGCSTLLNRPLDSGL